MFSSARTLIRSNRNGKRIGQVVRYFGTKRHGPRRKHGRGKTHNTTNDDTRVKIRIRDAFTFDRIRRHGLIGTFYSHLHDTHNLGRFPTKMLQISESIANKTGYVGGILGISYGVFQGIKMGILTLPLTCTFYGLGFYALASAGGAISPFLFPPIWFYVMFFV